MLFSIASRPSAGARAKWFNPRVLRSPCPAPKTRVRSRGCPVSRNLVSTATASSSGTPTPTNPPIATVSPSRITRAAASALMILFRRTALPSPGLRHPKPLSVVCPLAAANTPPAAPPGGAAYRGRHDRGPPDSGRLAHHRSRAERAVRRLLRRFPWVLGRGDGLAGGTGRSTGRALPRETAVRRGGVPGRARARPGGQPARAGPAVRADVPAPAPGRVARAP